MRSCRDSRDASVIPVKSLKPNRMSCALPKLQLCRLRSLRGATASTGASRRHRQGEPRTSGASKSETTIPTRGWCGWCDIAALRCELWASGQFAQRLLATALFTFTTGRAKERCWSAQSCSILQEIVLKLIEVWHFQLARLPAASWSRCLLW